MHTYHKSEQVVDNKISDSKMNAPVNRIQNVEEFNELRLSDKASYMKRNLPAASGELNFSGERLFVLR